MPCIISDIVLPGHDQVLKRASKQTSEERSMRSRRKCANGSENGRIPSQSKAAEVACYMLASSEIKFLTA
jgi:hypothetical protein